MKTIVIDGPLEPERLQAELKSAAGLIEFRDAAGNLVARFERKRTLDEMRALVVDGDWPSDEELDRIAKHDQRYTTAEVLAHLRGLSQ